MYDILIKNGRIIDPSRGIDAIGEILIKGDRIASGDEYPKDAGNTDIVIDAEDCIVVPGLIDFHTHLFYGGSELGIPPALSLMPNGITTAVDAGTAGCDVYEAFHNSVISDSVLRIKTFVNVCPVGQTTSRYSECIDPRYYDLEKLKYLLGKYRGEIIGLKIRLSKSVAGDLGLKPLEETIKLADKIGCPIVIHPTDPPCDTDQIVDLLRKGDIFVHMYHGTGNTILDESMKVKASVKRARERGVLFDSGEGRRNFSFRTARAAVADSFLPDIVSSDINAFAIYRHPVISLPNIISKYLCIGMELGSIIKGCTCNPACVLGMQDSIGTLKPGAYADVGIFKLIDSKVSFFDSLGKEEEGTKLFMPVATIKSGKIVFRRLDLR